MPGTLGSGPADRLRSKPLHHKPAGVALSSDPITRIPCHQSARPLSLCLPRGLTLAPEPCPRQVHPKPAAGRQPWARSRPSSQPMSPPDPPSSSALKQRGAAACRGVPSVHMAHLHGSLPQGLTSLRVRAGPPPALSRDGRRQGGSAGRRVSLLQPEPPGAEALLVSQAHPLGGMLHHNHMALKQGAVAVATWRRH